MRILILFLVCLHTYSAYAQTSPTLAERLGYSATDKLLIVNGDDIGMSHAANAAAIKAMEDGLMTSGTIMVPCPWFPEIAAYAREHPEADFGLHLTHTSEWKTYKWGPVSSKDAVPGLVTDEGYFWPETINVYQHSTPEEVKIESKAQIDKALAAGIDVTHLDSHMGVLQYNPEYHKVYHELAVEYNLPIRMASRETLEQFGFPDLREGLEADGIVSPDFLVFGGPDDDETVTDYWKRILRSLNPGVTELFIHAAMDGEELRSMTNSWKTRATEFELFTSNKEIQQILEEEDIHLIGYRELRDLQRK
ncbi:MAG: polysaccharide deacetylase family protein [Rhodothermaceae bacterium]|nr:polysaccharide deacetylase family protein [Rhodothermaceae bacterium]